jgi:hypothetical protein
LRHHQALPLRRHDGPDPDLRFDRQKAGIQANLFVFRYGLRLLPDM